jgi:hypothetical protein
MGFEDETRESKRERRETIEKNLFEGIGRFAASLFRPMKPNWTFSSYTSVELPSSPGLTFRVI